MYTYTVQEHAVAANGRTIYGKLYLPDAPGKRPAVIISHGYNSCHASHEPKCRILAQHGIAAYAFDFCGGSTQSKSSGRSTDMTIFTEKQDLLAVIAEIRALPQVDGAMLFLMGSSMGGLVSALAAEDVKDAVRGLALFYPAFNIPEDWAHVIGQPETIPETVDFWELTLGRNFFLSMVGFSAFDYVGGFAGPVLLMTGDADEIVRPEVGKRVVSRYLNAKYVLFPGEAHGFTDEGRDHAMELVLSMIAECAKP